MHEPPEGAEGRDVFADFLGIEVSVLGEGRARAQARVAERHLNQHGTAHGAFLYALADAAFAAASNSRGERAVALATAFHHTAAARLGDELVAEADEEHVGRRSALYRVAVRNQEGRLVALFTGTVYRGAFR